MVQAYENACVSDTRRRSPPAPLGGGMTPPLDRVRGRSDPTEPAEESEPENIEHDGGDQPQHGPRIPVAKTATTRDEFSRPPPSKRKPRRARRLRCPS